MRKFRSAFFDRHEPSVHHYFQRANKLPTAEKTGLPASVVKEVNKAVESVLERGESNPADRGSKRKYTTTFTPDDRTEIERYADENGNASTTIIKFSICTEMSEIQTLNSALKTGPTVIYIYHSGK